MLTNLSFLNSGAVYPPKSEQPRINTYVENTHLFLSRHDKIWASAFSDLSNRLKKNRINIDTVLNYHQLLSKKIADFVCGEPPAITCGELTDELNKILSKEEFDTKLYETIIDVSRLGNGVLKIVGNKLSIIDAKYWFPITDPTNLKEITSHVIAYPINPDNDGNFTQLYCEIHGIGQVDIRIYKYKDGEVGLLQNSEITYTGLDTFGVIPLTNTTYSGDYYGIDDYQIINSIIKKLMWRFACANKVLDKHTDPSVTGPGSALEYDERTGMWFIPLGNYFKRDSNEDPEMKYLTWDGNLESNFKEIELLFEQLYILSEMGTAFLEGGSGGAAASGRALKLKMTSPRIKAQRLIGINSEKIKTAIWLLATVNGLNIKREDISIEWKEGLPIDPVERTAILVQAVGNKPIISQYTAVQKYSELSKFETEKELERIQRENALDMPEIFTGAVIEDE